MFSACNNIRDRTVTSTLYDSGCRVGEILTLKVKDIEFDEFGMRLTLKGTTGVRKVREVGDSVPTMREYLDSYNRKDSDDFVFIQLTETKNGEPMKWSQVNTTLRKVLKRTRIEKRIHAHLFRHTRATILARDMKEAPLENVMGWSHGSKMGKVYFNLDDEDIDNTILKVYGIEKQVGKERNVTYVPKVCPRCKEQDSNTTHYCYKFGMPLDEGTMQEFIENQREIEKSLSKMSNITPEVKALLYSIPDKEKTGILASIIEISVKQKRQQESLQGWVCSYRHP